jgi:hypothetical protein
MKFVRLVYLFCLINIFCCSEKLFSQNIIITGLGDVYMVTDDDKIPSKFETITKIRRFSDDNSIKNQFAINIIRLQTEFHTDNFRSFMTFQSGSLVDRIFIVDNQNPKTKYNYLGQTWFGAGIKDKFWFDAGLFPSFIGNESIIPSENFFSSRSILSYFEPKFCSGARCCFLYKNLFSTEIYLLNSAGGYEDNNENKTIGWHISLVDSNFNVHLSGVLGNEETGSPNVAKLHILNSISAEVKPIDYLTVRASFDYGTKDNITPDYKDPGKLKNGKFYGLSVQARYELLDWLLLSARLVYLNNEDGIYTSGVNGFSGYDFTAGLELIPLKYFKCRLYCRAVSLLSGEERLGYPGKIFSNDKGEPQNTRWETGINLFTNLDLFRK